MQLLLTVADPTGSGPAVDCVVDVGADAVVGEIRSDLLAAVGRVDGQLFCSAGPLGDETPLGLPPLLDGAVVSVDRALGQPPKALLELHVTGGPDSGTIHPLGSGEHGIGRALEADVRIDDPDVSRLHAVVSVGPTGVTVADLDSTNGTVVGGLPATRGGVPMEVGDVLQVGGSRLQLVASELARAACHADGEGRLQLNRPPRLPPPEVSPTVTLPIEPTRRDKARLPVIALVVPLVAGVALVAFTGNPSYLAFVLLSPLMVLGTFLNDRFGGRRSARAEQKAYDEALADARDAIATAVAAEEITRYAAHPGASTLLLAATGPTPRLWERRRHDRDFLSLRVGLADLPAAVDVHVQGDQPAERPLARSVPVTVPLAEVGVVGFAGARQGALASARFALAQLAAWHSPRHLGVVLLVADGHSDDWDWVRWLPHLRPVDGEDADLLVGLDAEQIRVRLAELLRLLDLRAEHAGWSRQGRWQGRSVIVVLDGARQLRRSPGVARLLSEGPELGVRVLCIEEQAVALPVECGATIEVVGETDTALRVTVRDSAALDGVVMDGVSQRWAQRFARALAPLEDATPDDAVAELPTEVGLLDLLPFDATDAGALETAWLVSPRSTCVPLGVGVDGPFTVDLRQDGPHALVAGTTGAGKSELLQALVAGLAIGNRPDELAFVLIDYKGGAAFKDCARLPHTVGTVTDLDGHLTERALSSLGAELRRRESVLRDGGCKDIDDYLANRSAGDPPLPRLVLVVDEFATLAEELPDFVGGLVGIAQRGRSLGVHLVLATQRPSGVVSADIRANTTLRIALRVTDAGESADVVDVKDAATISRATPGRAVARIGAGAVTPFQSARVGRSVAVAVPGPRLRPAVWAAAGAARQITASGPTSGPTDLSRLVDAACAAAAGLDITPVPSPWLPPLEDALSLADVPNAGRAAAVPYGLLDLPTEQRRAPLALDLEHGGHLLVAGGPRSGRTTLLRTLAGSLAQRLAPEDAHLYVIDGGSGLGGLAILPHCGAVVTRDQVARGDRLLARLAEEVERRQSVLAADGFASVVEQRAAAEPRDRLPWMVLMVDGWEGVQAAYDEVDHGRPLDVLQRLIREGAAAGLRVVLTGDRGVLTSRVGASISDRLLLRLADPGDYGLAGVPARQVPVAMPPGRGLLAEGAVEGQVALLDRDPAGPAQQAALAAIAASASGDSELTPAHQRPLRVEPLPVRVSVDRVRVAAKAASTGPMWTLVGVGGDELDPLGVDLETEGPAFVIGGSAGSGKSTALLTVARWLGHEGVATVVVAPPRSPLTALSGEAGVLGVLRADQADDLTALVAARRSRLVVIADDAEALHDSPIERPLCEMLRPHGAPGVGLVLAASATEMAGFFRGVTVEARRNRSGLLLGAMGPVEGDLLGVRVARGGETRPGRGLLVVRGRTQPVQVALD